MLAVIRCLDNRFTGQSDDLASLSDIILTGSRGLNIFVRGSHARIGKLGLKDIRVGVSEMALAGLLKQSVSSIVLLPM